MSSTPPRPLPRISEAAEQLGRRAQWLRRFLLRREAETGARLLIASGAGSNRPTYRVDLNEVRRVAPELFERSTEVSKALGAWRTEVKREMAAMRESIEGLDAQVGAVAVALRELNNALRTKRPPHAPHAPQHVSSRSGGP